MGRQRRSPTQPTTSSTRPTPSKTSPKRGAGWLSERLEQISSIGGYQKPDLLPDALKLDSNENYAISRQFQSDIIVAARKVSDVREYPLGGTDRLAAALSKAVKMPASMIAVGNGSDQILDMILGHLAVRIRGGGKKDGNGSRSRSSSSGGRNARILTSDPTFGFFEDRCRLYGMRVARVPFADGMRLDASEFVERAGDADIIYLDSPNNPTGFQFTKSDMQSIVRHAHDSGAMTIIDEAYGEFGDYTMSGMTRRYDSLVVVRTLSKSFGLAGLRLGYMIADRRIAEAFSGVIQYPYPLSTITIESGIEALGKLGQVREAAKAIKSERARIISTLRQHDAFEVFDSSANFVLFDARGAYRRVHAALAEQGISIRRLGRVGRYEGCLRVTVGTREMNSRFLLAVRDLLG